MAADLEGRKELHRRVLPLRGGVEAWHAGCGSGQVSFSDEINMQIALLASVKNRQRNSDGCKQGHRDLFFIPLLLLLLLLFIAIQVVDFVAHCDTEAVCR
jgi:hypothetical protein